MARFQGWVWVLVVVVSDEHGCPAGSFGLARTRTCQIPAKFLVG